MRQLLSWFSSVHIFFVCIIFLAAAAKSPAAVFVIDSTQSQLSLSGTVEGFAIAAQGSGSLTAQYQGEINAAVIGSTLQFTGSSTVAAIINGVWQPAAGGAAGSASADYGPEVSIPFFGTGYGAVRNFVFDMTSPALTLAPTNFNSSQIIFTLLTNSNPILDDRSSLGSGTVPLSGISTNTLATGSYITTNGNSLRLVVQVHTTFDGPDESILTLTGQIVATNVVASMPPVITSVTARGGNLILIVSNATVQSQLFDSTNLITWSPTSASITTNGASIIFTTPISQPLMFFRILK